MDRPETSSQLFSIPLGLAPRPTQMAWAVHGKANAGSVERYLLPGLWALHFYTSEARLKIDGRLWSLAPGCVSVVPPATQLEYEYCGLSRHLYVHFSVPELEVSLASGGESASQIRTWFAPGELPPGFLPAMERIAGAFTTAPSANGKHNSQRAQVGLWELLWQLVEISPQTGASNPLHPSLEKALRTIEDRLGERLNVAQLAHEVGLSHNQLTRIFVAHTGRTVIAYIRHRRAARASYLLRYSTLSITAIARQIGIPQLGQFNHLMHREFGLSPRAVRNQTLEPKTSYSSLA